MAVDKKIKQKTWFDVKVESLLYATLIYRVYAENAEQAASLIKNVSPNSVKHRLIGKKDIKIMVYDAGTTFLKFIKNLIR